MIFIDNTAPTLYNCPSSVSKTSEINMTSAVVTWTAPTATDNHDSTNPVPIKVTGSINSGDRVEAGTTHTIVYAATDQAGNQKKCTFTVTVTSKLVEEMFDCSCTKRNINHLAEIINI